MLSRLSIGTKVMAYVGLVVFVGLAVLTYVLSSSMSKSMVKKAETIIMHQAESYANYTNGVFREISSVVKNTADTLDNIFSANAIEDVTLRRVQNVVEALATSSKLTAYSFFYVIDAPQHLKANPLFQTESGNTIILLFDDVANGSAKEVQANDSIVNFNSVKTAIREAKNGNKSGAILVGSPRERSFGGHTFVGLTLVSPVYGKDGKLVGVLGALLDFDTLRKDILDPSTYNFDGELRGLLYKDGTTALHSVNDRVLKRLQDLLDKKESANVIDAVNKNQTGLYEYISSSGQKAYSAIQAFKVEGTDSSWMMLISAPKSSVYTPVVFQICSHLVFGAIFWALAARFGALARRALPATP